MTSRWTSPCPCTLSRCAPCPLPLPPPPPAPPPSLIPLPFPSAAGAGDGLPPAAARRAARAPAVQALPRQRQLPELRHGRGARQGGRDEAQLVHLLLPGTELGGRTRLGLHGHGGGGGGAAAVSVLHEVPRVRYGPQTSSLRAQARCVCLRGPLPPPLISGS
jgi:hypothetical protein